MLLLGLLNFTNFAFASILFKIWILYLAETNNYWWYCFLLWILPSLNLFQRCMACYFILNQEHNIFRGLGSFFLVHFSRFTQQVSICSFFFRIIWLSASIHAYVTNVIMNTEWSDAACQASQNAAHRRWCRKLKFIGSSFWIKQCTSISL